MTHLSCKELSFPEVKGAITSLHLYSLSLLLHSTVHRDLVVPLAHLGRVTVVLLFKILVDRLGRRNSRVRMVDLRLSRAGMVNLRRTNSIEARRAQVDLEARHSNKDRMAGYRDHRSKEGTEGHLGQGQQGMAHLRRELRLGRVRRWAEQLQDQRSSRHCCSRC